MNEANTEALVRDFPKIFRHRKYFECGDGWEAIIREACEDIEPLLTDHEDEACAMQVKEKFGGLRFYMSHIPSDIVHINDIILEAEEKSTRTCETCGKPGKQIRINGWVSTTCGEMHQK